MKIKVNRIKCLKCGDIITSESVHDYKSCSCGSCFVDGGNDYLRRGGSKEYREELSIFEPNDEEELEEKCAVYHHLAQSMYESKLGKVQDADKVFDELINELENLDEERKD